MLAAKPAAADDGLGGRCPPRSHRERGNGVRLNSALFRLVYGISLETSRRGGC